MTKEAISLCIERKERPVRLDSGGGVIKEYTLRELTGQEFDKWKTGATKRYDTEGNLSNHDGFWASLIAMCMVDSDGAKVPLSLILNFPASAQRVLFSECQKLNAMVEEDPADPDADPEKKS